MIDWAHAEPVTAEMRGRQVFVVLAVGKYERLTGMAVLSSGEKKKIDERGE